MLICTSWNHGHCAQSGLFTSSSVETIESCSKRSPATYTLALMPSESRIVLRRLAQSNAIIFDSLHDSLADAQSMAAKEFGVSRGAWVNDFPSPSSQDSAES